MATGFSPQVFLPHHCKSTRQVGVDAACEYSLESYVSPYAASTFSYTCAIPYVLHTRDSPVGLTSPHAKIPKKSSNGGKDKTS